MGEMADFYINQALDAGESPFGGRRSRQVYRDPWCETCKHCGKYGLKWRLTNQGQWQLYENTRVEHNRLKEHVCPQNQPTAEGFEDVE